MSYDLDYNAAIDAMVRATAINDEHGYATLYANICVSPNGSSSHGGILYADMMEAEGVARDLNEGPPTEENCHYLPVAVALSYQAFLGIISRMAADPPQEENL